jgi:hypothetical protein
MLLHPSIPSPSGVSWWLWPWVKPKIYDRLEWSASKYGERDNMKRMSTLVVLLLNDDKTSSDDDKGARLLSTPKVCGMRFDQHLLMSFTAIRCTAQVFT